MDPFDNDEDDSLGLPYRIERDNQENYPGGFTSNNLNRADNNKELKRNSTIEK